MLRAEFKSMRPRIAPNCLPSRNPSARRSWPDVEDAAGRFAQGASTALQGGALVAGHGRFMHLLDPAGTEHTDQRQGHLIAWRIGGHRQHGTLVTQHRL